ncbi:MAG TPA: hypothetical protein VFG33_29890 [Kribbella sp.]|uniref:hypothetical protein n=1 Tax=Kribbella sp. TaxID=1871183 RepID=UPI002D7923DF|nr:hypothetical protein [Kribbella sp.]HET6297634.1 hypothetical protein [Kribbella sp.]
MSTFIQGLTDQMAHHANQTMAYGDLLGTNGTRVSTTSADLVGPSWRGPAAQSNLQGSDNWVQAANLKGRDLAHRQGEGGQRITGHYEQHGSYMLQQLSSVSMPTA